MPNPYDDLFDFRDDTSPKQPSGGPEEPQKFVGFQPKVDLDDPRFLDDGPEALDEILKDIQLFNDRAVAFSRLLSQLSVADHAVKNSVARLFFVFNDPQDRGSLAGERQYHELQEKKFRLIIRPMRELAELHQQTVKDFKLNIDKDYYSIDKSDREVQSDLTQAMNGINLQRRVLGDACSNLEILASGLADTERRMKQYINAGYPNNISESEYELIVRNRRQLTTGLEHQFDYMMFNINLLDKTALGLGIFLKETSNQYLKRLEKAMN